MNCIICTDEIQPQPVSGWDKGDNPKTMMNLLAGYLGENLTSNSELLDEKTEVSQ